MHVYLLEKGDGQHPVAIPLPGRKDFSSCMLVNSISQEVGASDQTTDFCVLSLLALVKARAACMKLVF